MTFLISNSLEEAGVYESMRRGTVKRNESAHELVEAGSLNKQQGT